MHFLAIDLGASTGRVMDGEWRDDGLGLREVHRFANDPARIHGHLHWDPLHLWNEIVSGLTAFASETHTTDLAGLSVDTWGVDYALLDGSGRMIGNPYHYRDDRTADAIDRLLEAVPARTLYQTTGIQAMQINTLVQLYSMVEHSDPQLAIAAQLLFMPDLFAYWLSGERLSECTIASTSQMLEVGQVSWAEGLLERLSIPKELLPEVAPAGTVVGPVLAGVARECNLRAAPRVIAGASHDTASAVASISGLTEDAAYISSGTWSLVGMELAQPIPTPAAERFGLTNEAGLAGRTLLHKNIVGLWLLQECRRLWERDEGSQPWDRLLSEARDADPLVSLIDPDDPSFLAPADMPQAILEYCRRNGEPAPTTRGAMVRCCLESLALSYRLVIEGLQAVTGRTIDRLFIVGGGSRNDLLNQFAADACAVPVVAGPAEATAAGNVIAQALAVGRVADLETARSAVGSVGTRKRYTPRRGNHWREAYERFGRLRAESI